MVSSTRFSTYVYPVAYVYGIVQTSTNELLYVGRTINPDHRLVAHKSSSFKDIKDDCHMVIFNSGYGMGAAEEYFWIRYFRFLGCNLRNKRTESEWNYAISHGSAKPCYVFPHLSQEMNERGIDADNLAKCVQTRFTTIIDAKNGGLVDGHLAKKIRVMLHVGTGPFEMLTDKERRSAFQHSRTHLKRMIEAGKQRLAQEPPCP